MSSTSTFIIKNLAEDILESLDKKPSIPPQSLLLPQLSTSNVKILINSSPLIDQTQFSDYWHKLPLSQHRLQSYDFHTIPGLNITNVLITGKVRFDESGKNKLGESADLIKENIPQPTGLLGINTNGNSSLDSRPIWGSWFGFTLNCVIDASKLNNAANSLQKECVNSLDYKINYIPKDSLIQV